MVGFCSAIELQCQEEIVGEAAGSMFDKFKGNGSDGIYNFNNNSSKHHKKERWRLSV